MALHDSLFHALSDPTRRTIISLLRRRDMAPGEIIGHLSMTKPSLSHHLDVLKRCGLVLAEREGQKIMYSLNMSVYEEIVGVVMDLFGKKGKR